MPVNVNINEKKPLPGPKQLPNGDFSGLRYGFWGMVTEVHPEDNTVHVRMDTGRELSGVRVASFEWVTIDKDKEFLSGERRLPPVNTFVFCLMPTGEPSSAFVLCSGFGYQVAEHAAFKEKSEDAKHTKKRVDNSGWVFTDDNRTGTKTIQNKPEDPTIKIEFDQENGVDEKVTLTAHKNIITIDKDGGVKIATNKDINMDSEANVNVNAKGNATLNADGNIDAKAGGNIKAEATGNADIKGTNVTVEALALLTLKTGDAAALAPNIVTVCPFGFNHGGKPAGIVKLCGM